MRICGVVYVFLSCVLNICFVNKIRLYIFIIEQIAINLKVAIDLLKFHTDFEFHNGSAPKRDFDEFPKNYSQLWELVGVIVYRRTKEGY